MSECKAEHWYVALEEYLRCPRCFCEPTFAIARPDPKASDDCEQLHHEDLWSCAVCHFTTSGIDLCRHIPLIVHYCSAMESGIPEAVAEFRKDRDVQKLLERILPWFNRHENRTGVVCRAPPPVLPPCHCGVASVNGPIHDPYCPRAKRQS
jgi:hypothetical protein